MKQTVHGIVVRDYKYEQNRILTILTKEHGLITAFANKANQPRSRLAASTELFCYSEFVLFESQNNYFVDNAHALHLFFGIRADLEYFALASYFAQLFLEYSPQADPAEPFVQLLLNCLYYLERGNRPFMQIKAVAELRLLTLAGYMPNLVGCMACSIYESPKMFITSTGDLLCGNCAPPTGNVTLQLLTPGVLAAMRHIIYSKAAKLFSFTLSIQGITLLADVSERYLLYHFGTMPTALTFFHQIASPTSTINFKE